MPPSLGLATARTDGWIDGPFREVLLGSKPRVAVRSEWTGKIQAVSCCHLLSAILLHNCISVKSTVVKEELFVRTL